MVQQKTIDLNQPLDAAADASIRRMPLEPELATVALTLHGDYYRQAQSMSNRQIVWHPLTQAYIWIVMLATTIYVFSDVYVISESVGEFFDLFLQNKFILTRYFPSMIFVAGTVGIISFTITDEFRSVSDDLTKDAYMAQLFRFPLKIYANAKETDMNSAFIHSASQTTDFIEYRNSQIAVVTVVPLPDESTKDSFVAKVSGLHVRKAYNKAGLEQELLQFAVEKARSLCNRYVKDNKLASANIPIRLVAEAYSIDVARTKFYKDNGFEEKSSTTKIDPFSDDSPKTFFFVLPADRLLAFFGVKRVTYELVLDTTVDASAQSSAVNTNKTKAKKRA